MKVIISGGGTGGHIYPAIAIANELKRLDPNTDILFVGAEGKMEMEKVPRAGYRIEGLPVVGIKRELTLANLAFPLKLGRSLLRARQIVRDFKPDVAVGVGGYASGPTLLAAALANVPILIQEQNSFAGLTNKVLARWAKRICVAYPGMDAFFPAAKIKLTGNPVRSDIQLADQQLDAGRAQFGLQPNVPTLLVIGGSQGARTLNESMEAGLSQLKQAGIQVIWQTGTAFIDRARKAVAQAGASQIQPHEFIYEMDKAYAVADAVVSRAGALSVSELCIVGRPAILVPLPTAAEDHQTHNAMALVNRDAALLVNDRDARQTLIAEARRLLSDLQQRKTLSEHIKQLAFPSAAVDIAQEVILLTSRNKVV
ncbi:undecaprenyldiphospho-muramoylpentapeptide beta-N-acetylglucosaminyltransferase [Fibrella forsythiae]|uniref:UDP-N-acetylglucosamine--N-acetylmuramyl-(pentapeptide) pyrophosphoryl-undecaprenol N-acetylglucosamine transferase n=1 Tax=Fibrella forsythiae TaxID=2817061 RepID=A0ABS3JKC7_9BACT|nr:undecaprenyldiphospho-muramoylpentapeptide beta-N-acetylglucosaminyltransferase [Fibrella forsythiae]MBO0950470.1 undecaprenyldiphospho-muramoylpentapeptide beta-N-acetylglucosaminyltransferase [Fibrella forsythiae]